MAQAEEIRTETGPLDYDYTEKEVELCQENLQNHKACSPDKIKNEMLNIYVSTVSHPVVLPLVGPIEPATPVGVCSPSACVNTYTGQRPRPSPCWRQAAANMFIMMLVKDTVAVPALKQGSEEYARGRADEKRPTALRSKEDMLTDEIHAKYANKVIPGHGLCIACAEIAEAGPSRLVQAQSELYTTVVIRLVMFRPVEGEILLGTVLQSDPTGFIVSLGFFAHVFIPAKELPFEKAEVEGDPPVSRCVYVRDTSSLDESKMTWFWEYRNPELGEKEPTRLSVDVDDVVRFRVLSFKYIPPRSLHDKPPPKPTCLAELAPNMLVIGSINEDGLGPLSWWNAEEDDEDEESGVPGVSEYVNAHMYSFPLFSRLIVSVVYTFPAFSRLFDCSLLCFYP
eukprot:g1946.t1